MEKGGMGLLASTGGGNLTPTHKSGDRHRKLRKIMKNGKYFFASPREVIWHSVYIHAFSVRLKQSYPYRDTMTGKRPS